MEALSIQAVKANYRPAATPAQSGLGDAFQAMLRDNAERPEQLNPLPRADDQPNRDAPWDSVTDDRAGATGGDRPYESDTDDRADDVSGIGAPRQTPTDPAAGDRQASADGDVTPAANQSDASAQPPDGRDAQDITPAPDSGTPVPGGAQGPNEQIATVSDIRAGTPEPALPNVAQALVAPSGGNSGQTGQGNTAAGVPAAAAPAASQTQTPASSQPSAPSAGTAATSAAGGNGFSLQVTATPAQVVATPNASLGGGAATAAIAAVGSPELTTPATPNAEPANRATQSAATAPASSDPSPLGAGRQPGASPNAPIVPTDGQALATLSASTPVAAAAAQKPGVAPADSQIRNGATLNAPVADAEGIDAPIQKGLAETAPTRPTQGNPAQMAGGTGRDVTGLNGSTTATNAQNQAAPAAAQPQTDQAAKVAMQGAQAGVANALAQGSQTGDVGSRGGSTASTDAAAGRTASVATAATGGFAQTAVQAPDTLGSLTRSGGTHPTTANQVAVEIQKAVNAGKDQIRIRLHPAELGQIDVSLKVRQDGTVRVVVTTDRPETFDLMQRDARGLERALQDAGLKTDSGSLSFNLRGGDQQGPDDSQRGPGLATLPGSESDRKAAEPPPEVDQPAPVASNHTLDIHV